MVGKEVRNCWGHGDGKDYQSFLTTANLQLFYMKEWSVLSTAHSSLIIYSLLDWAFYWVSCIARASCSSGSNLSASSATGAFFDLAPYIALSVRLRHTGGLPVDQFRAQLFCCCHLATGGFNSMSSRLIKLNPSRAPIKPDGNLSGLNNHRNFTRTLGML